MLPAVGPSALGPALVQPTELMTLGGIAAAKARRRRDIGLAKG